MPKRKSPRFRVVFASLNLSLNLSQTHSNAERSNRNRSLLKGADRKGELCTTDGTIGRL